MTRAALPRLAVVAEHKRPPFMVRKLERETMDAIERVGHRLRATIRWAPLHTTRATRQREMYVQRMEAVGLVLQCLIRHMDIVSLVVGRSEHGEQFGMKLATIAEKTGLGERRVDRAIRDLHASGFLVSKTRAERTADGYRGLTAVRALSVHLFAALGMASKLETLRQKVYRRRQNRPAFEKPGYAYDQLRANSQEFKSASGKRYERGTARKLFQALPKPFRDT